MKLFRETVIWLLTNPLENYDNQDVIQCALAHGASKIFWQIINTKSVFQTDGNEISKWIDKKNQNRWMDEKTENYRYWTMFDVTNFSNETFLKPKADAADSAERTALCSECPRVNFEDLSSKTDKRVDEEQQINSVCNKDAQERNFHMPSVPAIRLI